MSDEKVYSENEIEDYLKNNLPDWYFESGWITKRQSPPTYLQ